MTDQFQFALDPAAALEQQINHLLFGRTEIPLTTEEREILLILRWHKGASNAKPLADFAAKLNLSPRSMKQHIRNLAVTHKLPIGGSRQEPYGFFLCVTAEDIEVALRPIWNEIKSLLQRAHAVGDRQRVLEMLGQMQEEFSDERRAG